MTSKVFIFNASSAPIRVIINNGDAIINVTAADSTTWAPGDTGTTSVAFSGSLPTPGVFGYGENQCAITPSTGGGTATAVVNIPKTINPSDAIQLYLFYQSTEAVSWMVCDNGRAVAGNLSLGS